MPGVVARLAKNDLRLREALYETLPVYLLLTIGLKGGVELTKNPISLAATQALEVIAMGLLLPLLAYPILRFIDRMNNFDSAAIAAHYGSETAVKRLI